MATYRVNALPGGQRQALNDFLNQYIPSEAHDKVLKEIDATGTVSPETLQKLNFNPIDQSFVTNRLSSLLSGLPSQVQGLQAATDSKVTEDKMTDTELNNRLGAYKDISALRGQGPGPLERGKTFNQVAQSLSGNNVKDQGDYWTNIITDLTTKLGRFPTADEINQANLQTNPATAKQSMQVYNPQTRQYDTKTIDTGQPANVSPEIQNYINNQDVRNKMTGLINQGTLSSFQDPSADISRIQTMLEGRTKLANQNRDLASFIGGMPQQLADQTNQFINTQTQNASGTLADVLYPQILQNYASRGLAYSGDLGDALLNQAGSTYGAVQDQAAQLMAQDQAFFQQAAYSDTLRKAIESGQDLTSAIQTQQANATTQQNQRFSSSQTALNNQQQLDLFRRQQERALLAQQQTLKLQQSLANNKSNAGLGAAAGTAAGAIIGTALAPGGGTLAGAQLGATLGGTGGGAIGSFI